MTASPLCGSVRLWEAPGPTDTQMGLFGDLGAVSGPVSPIPSSVVRPDVRHAFGCALPTLGGACDCGALPEQLWTSYERVTNPPAARVFGNDSTQLLAEGSYTDDGV